MLRHILLGFNSELNSLPNKSVLLHETLLLHYLNCLQ